MLSVDKDVVFLLLLKNIENELFSIKGSESSKFKNCFSELFYVPDDSPFLLDSKTPSFLRNGSVIFEILSFETSLGGGVGDSHIVVRSVLFRSVIFFFKLTKIIYSYIYSAARGHPKYVI